MIGLFFLLWLGSLEHNPMVLMKMMLVTRWLHNAMGDAHRWSICVTEHDSNDMAKILSTLDDI